MTPQATRVPFLSDRELARLTRWKWVYQIEAHGFSPKQAARILWLRFLVDTGRLVGDTARPGR